MNLEKILDNGIGKNILEDETGKTSWNMKMENNLEDGH
jgi:hypothetical protein